MNFMNECQFLLLWWLFFIISEYLLYQLFFVLMHPILLCWNKRGLGAQRKKIKQQPILLCVEVDKTWHSYIGLYALALKSEEKVCMGSVLKELEPHVLAICGCCFEQGIPGSEANMDIMLKSFFTFTFVFFFWFTLPLLIYYDNLSTEST